MSLRNTVTYDLWTLSSGNQFSPMIFCKDYKNIVFTFVPNWLPPWFTTQVALYTNTLDNRPNIWVAASSSNIYSLSVLKSEDWSVGGTTIAWKLDDSVSIKIWEPYQSFCTWIGCKFFTYQSGSIRVSVTLSNNE